MLCLRMPNQHLDFYMKKKSVVYSGKSDEEAGCIQINLSHGRRIWPKPVSDLLMP